MPVTHHKNVENDEGKSFEISTANPTEISTESLGRERVELPVKADRKRD